jgi:hypothetical protein
MNLYLSMILYKFKRFFYASSKAIKLMAGCYDLLLKFGYAPYVRLF